MVFTSLAGIVPGTVITARATEYISGKEVSANALRVGDTLQSGVKITDDTRDFEIKVNNIPVDFPPYTTQETLVVEKIDSYPSIGNMIFLTSPTPVKTATVVIPPIARTGLKAKVGQSLEERN